MQNEDDAEGVAGAAEASDVGDALAARTKAESILARDRATVDEIAWAWITLRDLERGSGLTSGEARYRKILFAKEEIEKLGLLRTDEAGFPVRKYGGVPVSGMNDRAESQGLVSVSGVREAMLAAGGIWPTANESAASDQDSTLTNRTGGRGNMLDYITERAIQNVRSVDWMRVYDEIARLANAKEGPFKDGLSQPGCVKYKDPSGETREFTREAVRKKMERWIDNGRAEKLLNSKRTQTF
ncbi:hypothetical protein [Paraburkholderia heleia]|uniref:hypothetical protein n=1 Tax=Paraburkholderia heleia TaxID=634127 RepID=UPI002AB7DD59|nr:hypothetical protein [Paraburkholderia heleia]